jgi:hypothetical protein
LCLTDSSEHYNHHYNPDYYKHDNENPNEPKESEEQPIKEGIKLKRIYYEE